MSSLQIFGAGGGGDKSEARTPVEAPNTLRSKAKARILDLIAHGPIYGLANGLRSIILDDTPLQNEDDTFNFEGVTVHLRNGYPDQEYIPGFPSVENTVEVATEVKYASPVIRAVTNTAANAVLVTVQVQGLTNTDKSNGDIKGHTVPLAVDVRYGGGNWLSAVHTTISGKTTATYQRTYRVELNGRDPELRVRRLNQESETSNISDKLYWYLSTEVIDAKLNYPDSALVGLELDAALFGSQLPSRSYDMKLSIISVPSNYDPETRKYTGMWDGTFKQAWTDNPAWAYYDLATHPVIGADVKNVDKWALYQIAQYCDELVPDGYGGMEPRFTINTLFASREDAINVLNDLASVFRGMCYWGSDTLVPVADMPGDPVKLVTPANVINGDFEYAGTSMRERHSVAIVMWNDPENMYKAVPEFVEDADSIDLFGWRETQVTAIGCTSRGQARRLGKWILYSERMETQSLSYAASMDHADLRPGDFIRVADPDMAGARMGGRLLVADPRVLQLDKLPEQTAKDTWFLSVMMPTGAIERQQVTSFQPDGTVHLQNPLSTSPLRGAVWVLSSLSVELPIFRVTSVEEDSERMQYRITATEHDPTKYNRVELDLILPETPTSYLPTGPVAPPMDITATVYKYLAGGTDHQGLNISWTPVKDVRVTEYVLEVQGPSDVSHWTVYVGPGTSFDLLDAAPGQWMIRLKAVTSSGRSSQWVAKTVQVAGLLFPVAPDSVDVSVATFSVSLVPRGAYPGATYEFWRSQTALTYDEIESNAVRLSVSTDLVDVGLRSGTQYFYYIRGSNAYGLSTWYPVQAKTLVDFDDILSAVDEEIRRPGGLFEEMIGEAESAAKAAIGDVRADVDAARGEASKALEAANGLVTRIGEVEAGITEAKWSDQLHSIRYQALKSVQDGSTARSTVEEETRASEDQALSSRITTVSASLDENKAQVQERLTALATADEALAGRISTLDAKVGEDIQAKIRSEEIARATADTALASRVTELEASIEEDVGAAIREEATVRATQDAALAQRITTIETNVGEDVQAKIQQEQAARASADNALASQITDLTAQTNDQFASVSQQFTAQTDYINGAVARAVTTVTVNGKKAVFGISVDGNVAEIGAVADRFYIYNPIGGSYTLAFAVYNGQTVIQDALIRNGSIDTAKIADAAITMAKISGAIQSDNYVEGISGWRLTKSGQFEINGQTAGQGKVRITNQLFQVFDANNTLRLRLGIWG